MHFLHYVLWYTIIRTAKLINQQGRTMNLIRKTVLHVETTYIDGAKDAPIPLKMVAAAAVIQNPWAGQGYVENLSQKFAVLHQY